MTSVDPHEAFQATKAVTVIDFRSLSYTGTTWLNLLVGSHPDVFSLVLPQRVYAALRGELEANQLCMLHGANCPFWPEALGQIDPSASLYSEIARLSGKSHLVLNNPFVDPHGLEDLEDDAVDVRKVTIVRDPRAMVASYLSRIDASIDDAIAWVVQHSGLAEVPASFESLRVRYEDAVADQHGYLAAIGKHVGLTYDANAVSFWLHEHHPAGGNGGPFALIRRHEGQATNDASIERRYERVSADPLDVENPERWREALAGHLDRFDEVAGDLCARWGYPTESTGGS